MRLLPLLFALASTACGYTLGAGGGRVRAVSVSPIDEPGVDVDAAGDVGDAVRRAIARGPRTRLVASDAADARLEVRLVGSPSGLAEFADTGARAAQYRATVQLVGRLVDRSGTLLWSSGTVTGEAEYLSRPGEIEHLEGARRRAISRAAEEAADRLIGAMSWRDG